MSYPLNEAGFQAHLQQLNDELLKHKELKRKINELHLHSGVPIPKPPYSDAVFNEYQSSIKRGVYLREMKKILAGICIVGVFCYMAWQAVLGFKTSRLEAKAHDIGWTDIEMQGFPYSASELDRYEQEISKSDELKSKAEEIEKKYGEQIPFPYTEVNISLSSGLFSQLITKGSFQMGCSSEQDNCLVDEKPRHEVELTHSFFIMKREVTQGFWKKIIEKNPSYFYSCGEDCPVEQISWNDAIRFSNELNDQLGLERCYITQGTQVKTVVWKKGFSCKGWRLPTEAEWEYAARGGEEYSYAGGNESDSVAWYSGNSNEKTHPACEKKKNGYGLCDMSGNVCELVWDFSGAYSSSKQVDPMGARSGDKRICRGGSWRAEEREARVSYRDRIRPLRGSYGLGFRLVRTSF